MDPLTSFSQRPPLFSGLDAASETQKSSAISSDFETFLKMLTVQMENQDPLNPVDSADYAVQLATFSSVEQQVLTNDLLASLNASMSGGGIGALGQWVGMDVRAGNTAYYQGEAIELAFQDNQDADKRSLIVRNELGQIENTIAIPPTETEFIWDGTLSDGRIAPTGLYTFSIESFSDGVLQSNDEVTPYNRVCEAIIENGQTKLLLEGDILVMPNDVSALRSPD